MAFPKILQKLFQNNGAGDKLNKSILPDISYNDLTNKPTIPAAVTVDSALSSTSTNPVQNKVVNSALAGKMSISPAAIELNPGTSATHGGFIDFHYKGDSSDYTARIIEGVNGKGRLDITASGGLFLNNQRVLTGSSAGLTVVAESYSANSWYRKYSDGWIEQWVYCPSVTYQYAGLTKTWCTFLVAFSSVPFWTMHALLNKSFSAYTSRDSGDSDVIIGRGLVTLTASATGITGYSSRPSGADEYATVRTVATWVCAFGK